MSHSTFIHHPEESRPPSNMVEILRRRAVCQADRKAYTFLTDGEAQEETLTYFELDRRARLIGAALQQMGAPGERVLLLYQPGLEYVAAFMGCLYAQAVAVPAYPARLNRNFLRLESIVADSEAKLALTTQSVLSRMKSLFPQTSILSSLQWLVTDNLADSLESEWREQFLKSETLAFLQYTSGSMSTPKGVMVSHGNLLHNQQLIQKAFGQTERDTIVSWLPLYHDMGLIGSVLQPLYVGAPCILMSPASFLQRPFRWLHAISRYRATTSGGANFAYDLCIRKITAEQKASLDLSSWSVAFNGSEPVRHETLARFNEAFGPCGFRPQSFYPCYGLAEATLLVSGGEREALPVVRAFDSSALEQNRAVESVDDSSRLLVGCGQALPEHKIIIVDTETETECAASHVGEIWVSGSSVAQGYWNRPEDTARTFQGYLSDTGEGPFLRTGDLGFFHDRELFITGRIKDLIIIRGLNYYPQDIELTIECCHAAVRPGSGAAFSVEVDGDERLVVVHEIKDRRQPRGQEIFESIRQALAESHELSVYAISLIKAGSLPKTSSGKIQRQVCRAKFLEGALDSVAEWRESTATESELSAPTLTIQPESAQALEPWLKERLAAKLGINPSKIDVNRPIIIYGLDSLKAIELAHDIEAGLGVLLPMTNILQSPSIAELSAQILEHLKSTPTDSDASLVTAHEPRAEQQPLSRGQQALWFLHQLAPDSAAYNIAGAVLIKSELEVPALRRAFLSLVERHALLRTTFAAVNGQPFQRVHEQVSVCFEEHDASTWDEATLNERLAAEAHRPFDLERGPLLRLNLFTLPSAQHVLLLVAHHIVCDFWSLAVMLDQLRVLYPAEKSGVRANLAPPSFQYADHVKWQEQMLSSAEGERLWTYWHQQLDKLPSLNLPTDRPRPPTQTFTASSKSFKLDADLAHRLSRLAQESGATLYMTLLAAFQVLLFRYTGQEDIAVGSPTSGRYRAALSSIVGYFVNPLVLRAKVSAEQTFKTFLAEVRRTVLDALEHQNYPFALLVERLQAERDPSRAPLFQVMFSLQKAHLLDEEGLSSLGLWMPGARLRLGELELEFLAIEQRAALFDLTLLMAEAEGGLAGTLEYNTDLFDEATIVRMLGHFQTLIEAVAEEPERRLSQLPLLTKAERDQLLVEWNRTQTEYQEDACIHQLVEAQVARTPGAVAVVFDDEQLTFAELNRRSNQLAHHLRRSGVGPEVPVAVLLERSLGMMVCLLGILKAGGAYVPLDPSYPQERLAFILEDAKAPLLITQQRLADKFFKHQARTIYLDADWQAISAESESEVESFGTADNLAYVIYTSGSTGKPKGVMVSHRSAVNFFNGMDERIGCGADDTLLAVTSISFDISVLELFWTLTRGARLVLMAEQTPSSISPRTKPSRPDKGMQFSLFYFASDESEDASDKYRLLLEGARFADEHWFTAVWTPERHFHAFGGLYPNPAVVGAGLATITSRVQIRGGSVVLPLHHPVRVVEEWAVVDNLSKGRVGLAFASGWHADDFVFFPENYAARKEIMFQSIETVQKLWRGEAVKVRGGAGNEIEVRIFPQPYQPEVPIWLTAAGSSETFVKAGEIGAGVLTHLLGQTLDEVAEKVELYRESLTKHGHDPRAGHVTLMLHTFIGADKEAVREIVRAPFTNYLRSSIGLIGNLIKSLNLPLDLNTISAESMNDLLDFAFKRYFETSALFGTPESCIHMIEHLKAIGVDEVACLIDFGVDVDEVLGSLPQLDALRDLSNVRKKIKDYSVVAQALKHRPTLMQSTPSLLRMLSLNTDFMNSMQSLRVLMLGGEALPPDLASRVKEALPCRLINMYGPTETTIWSSTQELSGTGGEVSIGRPIANTQFYILDEHLQPVPVSIAGEIYIGGDGLARGYLNRPELTATKFIPDSFGTRPGSRLYRTGDLARYLPDGRIEFLGRIDQQVKIRGFRVELEEIEAVLGEHPSVREAVVMAREDASGDKRLVAYVVSQDGRHVSNGALRDFIKEKLPDYMVPSTFVGLEALPLTSNNKIDRKALPPPEDFGKQAQGDFVAPQNRVEKIIAEIWQQALHVERVGRHDNFFDLGGHSLLMAQVHNQLQEKLEKDLALIKLLEYPTVSALAKYIDREYGEQIAFQQIQQRAQKHREGLKRQRQSMRKARS